MKWLRMHVNKAADKKGSEACLCFVPGLAFDDWDLDYYTQMFRDQMKRNPTSVECFDLAQSNRLVSTGQCQCQCQLFNVNVSVNCSISMSVSTVQWPG